MIKKNGSNLSVLPSLCVEIGGSAVIGSTKWPYTPSHVSQRALISNLITCHYVDSHNASVIRLNPSFEKLVMATGRVEFNGNGKIYSLYGQSERKDERGPLMCCSRKYVDMTKVLTNKV